MAEKQTVPITDGKLRDMLMRMWGMSEVLDAIKRASEFDKLPGFKTAVLLGDVVFAELRAVIASEVLREAARHGIDVSKTTSVETAITRSRKISLEIEMMDLADLADDEPRESATSEHNAMPEGVR